MHGRYRNTLRQLDRISPEDFVYAVSDYWFDVIPAVRSRSVRKMMVLHMEAPTLSQIITRGRPDVDPMRLASLHYWASQEWSLRRFSACRSRREKAHSAAQKDQSIVTSAAMSERRTHLFYLHPVMEPRLKKLGVRADDMTLVSYGLEVALTDAVAAQHRIYDAVWIGRVHRQKGIEDLLATLQHLAAKLPNFRAIFIGNARDALGPEMTARGLKNHVEFSGFVSEEEKIRLFKASRVFLMPSKHEGSPRVIGESLIAGTPVVAYEIPNYRPLFGNFVRYAPAFDLAAFQQLAEREILQMRSGSNYLNAMNLARFKQENSWETTQAKFLAALERMRR
jgi:glycosyltransferase involved in cell wall biosynthesis